MVIAPSARTRQIGDAAIAVLAEHGGRGLTHRAVDQAAGLPPGTTSNYARTRAALLTLALTRIDELDTAEATGGALDGGDTAAGPGTFSGSGVAGAELAYVLARLLDRWITDPGARRRVLARFELALEATRRPDMRAVYDEMGRAIRAQVVQLLAAAGFAHPERNAWTLIAWVEGTAFYALAGAGGAAVPSLDELRAQVTGLLASLRGD
jgi:DNA-binding transcriptional regulator YbjK